MPTIDVTDVLISGDVADQAFDVIRRIETVNNFGESTITTVIVHAIGAVQPLGDNSILREEQYTTNSNGITVWTTTPLYNSGRTIGNVKYQPDLILVGGSYYIVRVLSPWSDFGAGFYNAECSQIDFEDIVP